MRSCLIGVDRGAARQPTHQRNHGYFAQRPPPHRAEAEPKRPPPADPHRHAVFELFIEEATGRRPDDRRDELRIGRRRYDDRLREVEAFLECLLEGYAGGQPSRDAYLDDALLSRVGQQAVHAHAVDSEFLADLDLRQSGNEIKPRGAGRGL